MFGDFPSKDFPLLCKIVDANEPLSIHVHPDDSYAYEFENGQYGKSECWYIIDAEEDAEVLIGTTVNSKEELENQINQDNFLESLKVKSTTWRILFYSCWYYTFNRFRYNCI